MEYLIGVLIGACINGVLIGAIGAGIAYFFKKEVISGFKVGFVVGILWGIANGLL